MDYVKGATNSTSGIWIKQMMPLHHITLFSSLGTFEQMKEEISSDHTDASELVLHNEHG